MVCAVKHSIYGPCVQRPHGLYDQNFMHGWFCTEKSLHWATTCQMRPATARFCTYSNTFVFTLVDLGFPGRQLENLYILLLLFWRRHQAEIWIDSLTEKKKKTTCLFREHGREWWEGGTRRDRRRWRILWPIIRQYKYGDTYSMENVDSESGSQNGLWGIEIGVPAHEKEGTGETRDPRGSA